MLSFLLPGEHIGFVVRFHLLFFSCSDISELLSCCFVCYFFFASLFSNALVRPFLLFCLPLLNYYHQISFSFSLPFFFTFSYYLLHDCDFFDSFCCYSLLRCWASSCSQVSYSDFVLLFLFSLYFILNLCFFGMHFLMHQYLRPAPVLPFFSLGLFAFLYLLWSLYLLI